MHRGVGACSLLSLFYHMDSFISDLIHISNQAHKITNIQRNISKQEKKYLPELRLCTEFWLMQDLWSLREAT